MIRNVVFILPVLLFVSQSAFSQEADQSKYAKVGVQLRLDSVNETVDATGADKETSHKFVVSTARLLVSGEVTQSMSYLVRINMKSAGFGETGQDNNIAALERAYIDLKATPDLVFRVGRLPYTVLSIENDYSGMDVYVASYLNDKVGELTPITAGIEATYTIMNQSLSLAVVNGNQAKEDTRKGTQKSEHKNMSVAYRGSLFDGMVKPIVSYANLVRIQKGDGANEDDKSTATVIGVGAQFSFASVDLDLEYDTYKRPEYDYYTLDAKPAVEEGKEAPADKFTQTTALKDETTSIVTQVAYNYVAMNLRPFVKYSTDKEKTDGDDSYKAVRYALGVEYSPAPVLRYHVAYVNKKDTVEATDVTTKTTQIIVGLAAKI